MHIENRFNLLDEPWIPIADVGRVSLKQLFSEPSYRALGGNPVQKIALTKLLLAIAQAAHTPADEDAWVALNAAGMAEKCLAYLEQWRDNFYLYGEKPFLQMPAIKAATIQSFGAVLPQVSTGNTTVLLQSQIERELDDAERALLLVVLMGFGLGGKKTDNSVVLSAGYAGKVNDKGKPSTGRSGPSLGFMGYMHNFLIADTLIKSLWLNLFTQEQIASLNVFEHGLGVPPWHSMPKGENCETAQALKQSLMGRLLPLSRFCLLAESGLHYTEGLAHLGHLEGMTDPSVALNNGGKKNTVMWVNPERRPWRQLTALLGFMSASKTGFVCYQILEGLTRASQHTENFGIWSGGLSVSSNAGEQYVSGTDDYVESQILFASAWLNETWYENLNAEMSALDAVAKSVYGCTMSFYKAQMAEGKDQAAMASNLFWQLCEHQFQALVDACPQGASNIEKRHLLRKKFAVLAIKSYDSFCPKDTARQLNAWASARPNLSKYLSQS